MALRFSKKITLLFIVPTFLMVGGAAAFFFVISNTTNPVVEQDINNHFAMLENKSLFVHNDTRIDSSTPKSDFIQLATPFHSHRSTSHGTANSNASKSLTNAQGGKKKTIVHKKKNSHNVKFVHKKTKSGIVQIAPGTFLIQQDRLEKAKKSINQYVGGTRAELVEDQHGSIGFKLKGISKNSYLHAIGVRNGDVLIAINGHPLNSIENVTLAIASFQNAVQFRLDLLRNNKKISMYYKVVAE